MYNSGNKTKCDLGLGFSGTRCCDLEGVVSDVSKERNPLQGEKPLTPTHRLIFLVTSNVIHTAVGISNPPDLPCNMPQWHSRWKGVKV